MRHDWSSVPGRDYGLMIPFKLFRKHGNRRQFYMCLNVGEVLSTILAGSFNIRKRRHPSNAFQYIETIDNSQSSVFEFKVLEQPVETFERIFKTFNLSTMLHAEFLSRCIRNCSDYADGISKVMFSGDGREGVRQPASQPANYTKHISQGDT